MGKQSSAMTILHSLPSLSLQAVVLFACIHSSRGKVDPSLPSADRAVFPSSFSLDVTLSGRRVHLRLHKDRTVQPYLPVLALSTDRGGFPRVERARLGDADYAVFTDAENEAAFGVYREKGISGASVQKMEGVVHSAGTVYDLRSTGRTRRRHRRDVPGSDETADVYSDNNKEEGEGEAVEEEEFEVDILSDSSAAYDSDSLPKSLPLQDRRGTLDMARPMTSGSFPPRSPFSISQPSPPLSPSQPPPSSQPSPPTHRKKRQVTQDVYIDVVAVADYGVYNAWYTRSTKTTPATKKQDTLMKLRRYYAFVLNGVTMLYKSITTLPYTINVRLTGIVLSTMPTSSNWTEQFRVKKTPWDQINNTKAYGAIREWARTTDLLPYYDHLMVFTGYDLTWITNGSVSNTIIGWALKGTVCDTTGQASSIVEDHGGFGCIGTAAHELGHGLSADHDGFENTCRSEDKYVMSRGSDPMTDTNKLNPWKFSSCSVAYFNSFLTGKVKSARGKACVYDMSTVNNVPDLTSGIMEGQLYVADDQCRNVYGPQSRLCRPVKAADVCTDMRCLDPSANLCVLKMAARGTSCGNQKWCQNGQCVSSGAAPSLPENCVFGDAQGIAISNQTCETFVNSFPGRCYQEVVNGRCCSSCARHYRLVQDCEYGNRVTGCISQACSTGIASDLRKCCSTCNFGKPLSSTTTTTLPPPTTTTLRPPTTTTTTSTTTTTPRPPTTTTTTSTTTTTPRPPTTTTTTSTTTTTPRPPTTTTTTSTTTTTPRPPTTTTTTSTTTTTPTTTTTTISPPTTTLSPPTTPITTATSLASSQQRQAILIVCLSVCFLVCLCVLGAWVVYSVERGLLSSDSYTIHA